MKITITSTDKIVELATCSGGSIRARVWEGRTEAGVPCHAFIALISPTVKVDDPGIDEACREFERDLQEHAAPSAAVEVYPLRLVL